MGRNTINKTLHFKRGITEKPKRLKEDSLLSLWMENNMLKMNVDKGIVYFSCLLSISKCGYNPDVDTGWFTPLRN